MMEFINCNTLLNVLYDHMNKNQDRLRVYQLKFICAELILGLNFLHDNGIVHRYNYIISLIKININYS
jgi:serine/threonine protein kinase